MVVSTNYQITVGMLRILRTLGMTDPHIWITVWSDAWEREFGSKYWNERGI